MKLRHSLAVFALVPVLIFSLLPLAGASPAFEGPNLVSSWTA